jgi:hypothetical protein
VTSENFSAVGVISRSKGMTELEALLSVLVMYSHIYNPRNKIIQYNFNVTVLYNEAPARLVAIYLFSVSRILDENVKYTIPNIPFPA